MCRYHIVSFLYLFIISKASLESRNYDEGIVNVAVNVNNRKSRRHGGQSINEHVFCLVG
jgi:hypothetical protein